jgi:hypothetical protein
VAGYCVNRKSTGFLKRGECLYLLSDYQFLKKESVPWRQSILKCATFKVGTSVERYTAIAVCLGLFIFRFDVDG